MFQLPIKVFHKPYQSHLVSRQSQGKHMVHKLKPSQEKKEVHTREIIHILTVYVLINDVLFWLGWGYASIKKKEGSKMPLSMS